ncbi:MAG: cyclopropane fatty acyl phospholipid synthase [Sulfuriflexus sp.]|nr:cyclopropane fatty acyl phospholipid synthase [Sulfuriflexus sp.]
MLKTGNLSLGDGQSVRQRAEAPKVLAALIQEAGISFNGTSAWDIQIHDEAAYQRILSKGSLGLGEAYVDGLWDAHSLDELFTRLIDFDIDQKVVGWAKIRLLGEMLRHKFSNLQSTKRAFQVGEQHYDTGNDVFEAMLDPTMSYSCGFWEKAETLEQAQLNKLDMICRKLDLQPGEQLLEIGCGWGGLASYAAENYGVEVAGVTVSKEQQALARQRCAGLPVKIKLMDYRDLKGQFDKIVSVGMFEHVGAKNYPVYFESAERLLKQNGLFLLHTIGNHCTTKSVDPWIDKYIFPNGKLPSAREVSSVIENKFIIEDWHNFGQDYDKTLMAWMDNFDKAWPALKSEYSERFYRMWKYYLLSCAGYFRCRQGQLWQLVLSKRARSDCYRSVR